MPRRGGEDCVPWSTPVPLTPNLAESEIDLSPLSNHLHDPRLTVNRDHDHRGSPFTIHRSVIWSFSFNPSPFSLDIRLIIFP